MSLDPETRRNRTSAEDKGLGVLFFANSGSQTYGPVSLSIIFFCQKQPLENILVQWLVATALDHEACSKGMLASPTRDSLTENHQYRKAERSFHTDEIMEKLINIWVKRLSRTKMSTVQETGEEGSPQSFWSKPIGNFPGFTLRVLLIAFPLGLVTSLVTFYTIYVAGMSLVYFIPFPIVLLLELLIRKAKPTWKLSLQEWTIFFMVYYLMVNISATEENGYFPGSLPLAVWRFESSAAYLGLMPSVWGPADETILTQYWFGGPVDWGVWLVPTLYWGFVGLFSWLGMMFLAVLFSKIWIDVEELPYPWAIIQYEPLLMHEGKTRDYLWSFKGSAKWLWLGVLFGAVVGAPRALQYVMKWPPSLAWWSGIGFYGFNIGPLSLNGVVNMRFEWLWIAALAPLDTMMTFAIFDIIFRIIWPNAATSMGIIPTGLDYIWGVAARPEFPFGVMIDSTGMGGWTIGTGIFFLVISWKRIRQTLKYAVTGQHEENEPLSYRFAWIILVVAFIGNVYLWTMAAIPLGIAIIMQLYFYVMWIFFMRLSAEVVLGAYCIPMNGDIFLQDIGASMGYWNRAEVNQANFSTSMSWTQWIHAFRHPAWSEDNLATYLRFAKVTNTPYKGVSYVWLICIIILSMGGAFIYRYLTVTFGGSRYSEVRGYFNGYHGWSVSAGMGDLTVPTLDMYGFNPYPWVLGGLITSGVLHGIRMLYPWFPITPIGVWLGMAPHPGKDERLMLWIGFICKALTLRIGGARAYEKYYVPIFVGIAIGWALITFGLIPIQLAVKALGITP